MKKRFLPQRFIDPDHVRYEEIKEKFDLHPTNERRSLFSSFIVCNEFGSNYPEHKHSHAVFIMKEKLSFQQMKYFFKKKLNIVINDIKSCKKVKDSVHYCSKEDHQCLTYGIDTDMLSLKTKAYLAAKRFGYNPRLRAASYPFCNLPSTKRRTLPCFMENLQRNILKRKCALHWTNTSYKGGRNLLRED